MDTFSYTLDTTWRVLLKDLGIDAATVLRRAELPDALLHQGAVRVAPEAYYRLWQAIESAHGDPLFPIRLCESIRSESFLPPLFAALCSPNLLVAAQRVAAYKRLIGPMRMDVTQDEQSVAIAFSWPGAQPAPPPSLVLMELLFVLSLARMGTRAALRPLELMTTALPSRLAPYEDFAGAPFVRGARHAIRFARADALLPFLTSNDAMWSAFEPGLRQRLADLQSKASTTRRVAAALTESIPSGLTTMDAVARKLALSKRTLQRRIESEGSSFQDILRETREGLARHYLANTRMPASEISFLLGYDEPNSFYRAFKSWTGLTPDSIRQGV